MNSRQLLVHVVYCGSISVCLEQLNISSSY